MNIERYSYDELFGVVNGIKIDNAYDLYTLSQYKKIIKEEQIDYIVSQDYDLSYLTNYTSIKFLSVPDEVDDIEYIYLLKDLTGLRAKSGIINKLDLSKFTNLSSVYIVEDEYNQIDYNQLKNINNIYLDQFKFTDLSFIKKDFQVKNLFIDFCSKLTSLKGIENLNNLETIHLEYCLKLSDISSLSKFNNSLTSLKIIDCIKILNLETIYNFHNIKTLELLNRETSVSQKIQSLSFLDNFKSPEYFMTNYKVLDCNLKPLLRLKDVSILEFYKKYNLKDRDLPHEDVIVKISDNQRERRKVKDLEDGINNKNIIWTDE